MELLGDVANEVEWIETDILDASGIGRAATGVHRIYHCAAYLGFDGRRDTARLMRTNVSGTAHLVDAALSAGVERFVHTSSIAALGGAPNPTDCLDESAEWRAPRNGAGYDESKYRSELEIHRGIAEGLDAVIVNPSVIMGVGKPGENTSLLVDKIRSEAIPFLPTGSTNVVDVLDVVDGLLRAMEIGRTGERYILAGDNLSWQEIIETMASALGVRPPKRKLRPEFVMPMAVLFELSGRLFRKRPIVTRETVRLSARTSCYNNEKAVRDLGCTFRPFLDTASRIAVSLEGTAST